MEKIDPFARSILRTSQNNSEIDIKMSKRITFMGDDRGGNSASTLNPRESMSLSELPRLYQQPIESRTISRLNHMDLLRPLTYDDQKQMRIYQSPHKEESLRPKFINKATFSPPKSRLAKQSPEQKRLKYVFKKEFVSTVYDERKLEQSPRVVSPDQGREVFQQSPEIKIANSQQEAMMIWNFKKSRPTLFFPKRPPHPTKLPKLRKENKERNSSLRNSIERISKIMRQKQFDEIEAIKNECIQQHDLFNQKIDTVYDEAYGYISTQKV